MAEGPLILTPAEWSLCLDRLGRDWPAEKQELWRAGRMEQVGPHHRRLVAHIRPETANVVRFWLANQATDRKARNAPAPDSGRHFAEPDQ